MLNAHLVTRTMLHKICVRFLLVVPSSSPGFIDPIYLFGCASLASVWNWFSPWNLHHITHHTSIETYSTTTIMLTAVCRAVFFSFSFSFALFGSIQFVHSLFIQSFRSVKYAAKKRKANKRRRKRKKKLWTDNAQLPICRLHCLGFIYSEHCRHTYCSMLALNKMYALTANIRQDTHTHTVIALSTNIILLVC